MLVVAKIQTIMRRVLILVGSEFLHGTDLKMDNWNWKYVGNIFKSFWLKVDVKISHGYYIHVIQVRWQICPEGTDYGC